MWNVQSGKYVYLHVRSGLITCILNHSQNTEFYNNPAVSIQYETINNTTKCVRLR